MASAAAEREGKSYWGMSARRCDSCRSAPALLFCRADSAFLCGSCDAQVHRANKLASRHERVWMCEVCEQAPAAVTCKADAAALCVSCDADIHSANPLARRHDRIPVQPFDFLPTPTPRTKLEQQQKHHQQDDDDEEVNDNGDNNVDEDDDPPSMTDGPPPSNLFSDVDPYLNLEYAESMDAVSFNHTADSVVPNHGSLIQIADHAPAAMFFAAPPQDHDAYDVDLTQSKDQPHNFMYPPLSNSQSVSSSEVGVVPDGSATVEMSDHYVTGVPVNPTSINMSQPEPAVAAVGMDREARVMRYREKRKNRKFEKTIRYASRKAYAEKRPRIKGRFVKRTARDETTGYSVVPTF